MKRNEKLFFSFLSMLIIFFIFTKPALAAEEAIPSIDIDVALMSDGSALITEVWDIIEVYDGTEYYIVINLPETMSVHSLQVRDANGTKFETLDSWDVDASFEEKAYKAGILETEDGYEICWGISSFGDHTFTVQYTLTNLVKEYTDYAGFFHQFITHDLSSAPESISVKIHKDGTVFSEENTSMWSFGFDGDITFTEDGAILATSSESLSGSDYVNIMAEFDSDLFTPAVTADGDFASIREERIADEEPMPVIYVVLIVLAGIAISAGGVITLYFVSTRIKLSDGVTVRKPRLKDVAASNILPFNGSLPATYYALKKIGHAFAGSTALGSYLMKWEAEGIISIEKIGKKKINIIFNQTTTSLPQVELSLYDILRQAAGSHEVLSKAQLEKWINEADGYSEIVKWEEELATVGEQELLVSGSVEADEKGKIRFTQQGFEKIVGMYGFMKYLREFESFQKENDMHMELWGDYLIFATLLGMADDMKEYFKLHGDAFGMDSMHIFQIMLLTNTLSNSAVPKYDSSSSGIGGGGGFSGGGGGGGSR